MRLLLALCGLALAALLVGLGAGAIVWCGSERLLRLELSAQPAPSSAALDPESAAGLSFESVRFPTAGGSELQGWFVPGMMGLPFGIALVHGSGEERRAFLGHLPFLHEAGYSLLVFDLRDHGESDGAARGTGLGYRELHDVSAAVRYLKRERRLRRVAAFGISFGGTAVLLAAAGDPGIDVALAESPPVNVEDLARVRLPRLPEPLRRAAVDLALLRIGALGEPRPIDVVARIAPRPLVLIGSADDRVVSAASIEALFAAAREPKELWIAERGGHGAIFATEPEQYRQKVLTYLGRWLGRTAPPRGPATAPPVQ